MTAGFWWVLLFMAAYGGLHSLLASRRFKTALELRFGQEAMRWHRLIFSILGGLTILPALAMVIWLPDRVIYAIPYPVSSWFRLLQLIGLGVWSTACCRPVFSTSSGWTARSTRAACSTRRN